MKVNAKKLTNRSGAQSQTSNKYFNTTTQVLIPTTVSGNSILINSKYSPVMIIWLSQDKQTYHIDINPEKDAGENYVGNSYSLKEDFVASQAYYVPSEELLLSHLISTLNISLPHSSNISDQINFLGVKLEETNKTLSTWETYNIFKVAYNREELVSALAALPLSSSVLINTDEPRLDVGSWNLQKGDMLVKDAWGNLHHLKGSNGGFYFPSSITPFADSGDGASGLFQVNFTYSQETPLPDTKTITNQKDTELQVPYDKIKVQFPSIDQSEIDVTCYSFHGDIDSSGEVIDWIKVGSGDGLEYVDPIVYYYIKETGERILFDADYIPSTTKDEKNHASSFTVKNPTSMEVLCEVR